MATVVTEFRPTESPEPNRRAWTRDEYHRMAEMGIIGPDEHVELLDGQIVEKMPPIGPSHGSTTDRLAEVLRNAFGPEYRVREEKSILLINAEKDEPEPDIVVAFGTWQEFKERLPGPNDIRLIVEVADSSLISDRKTKGLLYAASGIVEYWIVNLVDRVVEVHTLPTTDGYAQVNYFRSGADLKPVALVDTVIPVDRFLPV